MKLWCPGRNVPKVHVWLLNGHGIYLGAVGICIDAYKVRWRLRRPLEAPDRSPAQPTQSCHF